MGVVGLVNVGGWVHVWARVWAYVWVGGCVRGGVRIPRTDAGCAGVGRATEGRRGGPGPMSVKGSRATGLGRFCNAWVVSSLRSEPTTARCA